MNKRQVKKQQKNVIKFLLLAEENGVSVCKACKTWEQGSVYEDTCSPLRNYKSNYGKFELKVLCQIKKNLIDIIINDTANLITV